MYHVDEINKMNKDRTFIYVMYINNVRKLQSCNGLN